tara:strand:+ start:3272 stop:3640 length:369 start_codon:yes stop_codon:yes gene_type:complete
MPMRIGFTDFRKQMLEEELKNIQELLPTLGVKKVILTGDMATENYSPDSPIKLIAIQEIDVCSGMPSANFVRREDFWTYHLNANVAVETIVYTPEEFSRLINELPALMKACSEGRTIYDDES